MADSAVSPLLTLQHINNTPEFVHDIYFTRTDLDVARLIHRHICLTAEQLYALIGLGGICVSEKRIAKLVKYGFLNRYRITGQDWENGKKIVFYAVSGLTRLSLPVLNPVTVLALLASNEFLVAQCRRAGKRIRYRVLEDYPVTAHIQAKDRLYVCIRPSGVFLPSGIDETDRVIMILPDEDAVPMFDEIIKTTGAPVRYVFDHTPERFWRFEDGALVPAQIALA